MNSFYKATEGPAQPLLHIDVPASEICHCQPVSVTLLDKPGEEPLDFAQFTPMSRELNELLRSMLASAFLRSTPLSLLVMHIAQLEHLSLSPESVAFQKRQRLHADPRLLEQVLVNVGRALRSSDQILTHDGTGAAMIFADVDQQGAFSILERVYRNISLLQAETVIPPLKRETDIVLGIGTYPSPSVSLEQLLIQAGQTARRFTLRPAVTPFWDAPVATEVEAEEVEQAESEEEIVMSKERPGGVPFMHLPLELPSRLKHLIPYDLALRFQCAPVGRDHHYLTVAMANPTDIATLKSLAAFTGLTIFPVSCEINELRALLSHKW